MRSEAEAERAVRLYADMVRRICMVHLKNAADTEDIFQTVFLKFCLRDAAFDSAAHEKAWLIRVTINACKDLRKNLFHRRATPAQAVPQAAAHREVLEAVLSLPPKYRDAVYLHYYEGYAAAEIGALLGKSENAIYTRLARARAMLRDALGGDGDE